MTMFKKINGLSAFLDGCPIECAVHEFRENLFVATGAYFMLLTALDDGSFADSDGRKWTVVGPVSASPSPVDSRDALIERLVKALRYMLAETDPYREGRGTDAEIAARRDAVAALNAFDSAALAAQEQS